MASNQASAAVGVAMVVAGMGLWGVATQAQVQRTRASEPATSPAASSAPRAPCPACPPAPACPAATATASGAAAAASGAASASAGPPASGAPSASASPAADQGDSFFRYEPGKITLSNDEKMRLITRCRGLLKLGGKLQIEGFGDDASPEGVALGRRRALLTRMLLGDAGFDGERLLLLPPSATPSGATGGVRVTFQEAKAP